MNALSQAKEGNQREFSPSQMTFVDKSQRSKSVKKSQRSKSKSKSRSKSRSKSPRLKDIVKNLTSPRHMNAYCPYCKQSDITDGNHFHEFLKSVKDMNDELYHEDLEEKNKKNSPPRRGYDYLRELARRQRMKDD